MLVASQFTVDSFLHELGSWGSVTTYIGLAVSGFIVWRAGSSQQQKVIASQVKDTIQSLKDAVSAEKARADAEKSRADQQTELASAWEIKNAELLRSSVSDQTKYLISIKALGAYAAELETKLGLPHVSHD